VGDIVAATNFVAPAVRATLVALSETGSLFTVAAPTDALFRERIPANSFRLVRLMVALPVLP
jgi:hypothetical protein